jgi:hypothetical protein
MEKVENHCYTYSPDHPRIKAALVRDFYFVNQTIDLNTIYDKGNDLL